MLAFFLYFWLGRDAAVAEIAAEILIGLAIEGGGGGKRLKRALQFFLERGRELPALAG